MYTLVSLTVSPWSEKARWALDHHRIAYRSVEYLPLVGEPILRLATGRLTGRISVPVLFAGAGQGSVGDSFDIARFADQVGQGTPLVPEAAAALVARWNRVADDAMAAGRLLNLPRMRQSPAVLAGSLPPFLPRSLRQTLAPTAGMVIDYLGRKYQDLGGASLEAARQHVHQALTSLRAGLDGRPHLVGGQLSLADVAMAVVLQGVSPVAAHHLRIPSALREAWTDPALSTEFADLISWRDGLYDRHRRPAA